MTDLSPVAASVVWDGKKETGRAGATVARGQLVYKDTTDNNDLKLADADVLASSIVEGVALNDAGDGQPLEYGYGEGTLTVGGTGVSVGATYALSTSAGGIAPESDLSTGDYMSFVGIGATTSTIKCNFFNSQVVHA